MRATAGAILSTLLFVHSAPAQSTVDDVRARVLDRIHAVSGATIAVAYRDLATGARFDIEADSAFTPPAP